MRGFRHPQRNHQGFGAVGTAVTQVAVPPPSQTEGVRVGSFDSPTATGNQSITGVGFMPHAIIFFGAASTNIGWRTGVDNWVGFAALNPSQAIAQSAQSVSMSSDSNYCGTTNASKTSAIFSNHYTTPNVYLDGKVVSMDTDGFTIKWNQVYASSLKVSYMCIGAQLTAANVVNWNVKSSSGAQAVIGAGFAPDVVIHLSAPQGPKKSYGWMDYGAHPWSGLSIGAMSAANQWTSFFCQKETCYPYNPYFSSKTPGSAQITTKALAMSSSATALDYEAAYTSLDADGFTVNWNAVPSTSVGVTSLCLKFAAGTDFKVSTFTKTANAGQIAEDISTGLTAVEGMLFVTDANVVSSSMQSIGCQSVSAGGNTNMASKWLFCNNAGTYQKGCDVNTCIAVVNTGNNTYTDSASISGLNGGTYTVLWAAGTANATQVCYVAFGG